MTVPHNSAHGSSGLHASSRFLRNAQVANAASGLSYDDEGYVPEQHTMYVAELNYRVAATKWLSVMLNLQHIQNPDGVREVHNAVAMGLEVKSEF